MDPETNLPDLTEDLGDTIDDLEEALGPLLSTPSHTLSSSLPTLDKAKLHILTAYTLESLLFQVLQASGTDAKSHRIFAELARLKTYFGKIKAAEAAGEGKGGPTTKLDKDAAARFIRHGLSGNERYDKERAERQAKEKARAALKARQMAQVVNRKFDDDVETKVQEELGRKRKAEVVNEEISSSDVEENEEETKVQDASEQSASVDTVGSEEDHVDSENAEFYGDTKDEMDVDSPAQDGTSDTTPAKKSKKSVKEKKEKKSSKRRKSDLKVLENDPPPGKANIKEPIAKRGSKKEQELIIPERGDAPRTRSETFNALLSGTFGEQKEEKKKKKNRGGKLS